MSIMKRLSATLFSRIDQIVGDIENHEAVIQSALADMHRKIAGAKSHLAQVNTEAARVQQHIQHEKDDAQRWRQRAIVCAHTDEEKALECLRRSRLCEARTAKLQDAFTQYSNSAEKLAADIEASEQRLNETKQKLILLRARQSATQAMGAMHGTHSNTTAFLDDSLARWEISIGASEIALQDSETIDVFERDFLNKESDDDLRRELTNLIKHEELSA